ncbi:MAG: ribosome maturation factor RimM [Actinomycetales bacterium]|nr:ribosome maturation factor RimM [Actinomycetales bacterium]
MQVVVGRIGRAQGIRGEVNVDIRTDDPDERFSAGAVLLKQEPGAGEPAGTLTVAGVRWQGNRLILHFAGVADRNAAEALRGVLLLVDRDEGADTGEPDAFYDTALIGCDVVTISGQRVGAVQDVLHLPGQDVLVVRSDDEREVLVPFVAAIVPTVDVANRRIAIDPPAGLLDVEPSRRDP